MLLPWMNISLLFFDLPSLGAQPPRAPPALGPTICSTWLSATSALGGGLPAVLDALCGREGRVIEAARTSAVAGVIGSDCSGDLDNAATGRGRAAVELMLMEGCAHSAASCDICKGAAAGEESGVGSGVAVPEVCGVPAQPALPAEKVDIVSKVGRRTAGAEDGRILLRRAEPAMEEQGKGATAF